MQFIYGMGIEAFEARAAALAAQYGAGFALSPEVKAAIRQHQPVY
jgi:3-hydroxyacyl-CoA dehydrogenase/enoyl-CoA hydratase/3-hydroxybutyryl-CoA epimerase